MKQRVMQIVTLIGFVALITGCANTAKKLNQLSLGMTKQEVISILGNPDESRASQGVEYMIYSLGNAPSAGAQVGCGVAGLFTLGIASATEGCRGTDNDYFVQFKNGSITAYGRIGDFGTTQTPESTININKTVRTVE